MKQRNEHPFKIIKIKEKVLSKELQLELDPEKAQDIFMKSKCKLYSIGNDGKVISSEVRNKKIVDGVIHTERISNSWDIGAPLICDHKGQKKVVAVLFTENTWFNKASKFLFVSHAKDLIDTQQKATKPHPKKAVQPKANQ